MRVLVIGGAGFIGSHLVDALISEGHSVSVLDSLEPQVHGEVTEPPEYLNPKAEFILGNVLDRQALKKVLKACDAVFYKAAAVGVGQSMYQISRYVEANSMGAANFLQVVIDEKITLKKIVVASSMSVYGEGAYKNPQSGASVYPRIRSDDQLENREWDFKAKDGTVLHPVATTETKPLYPTSVYAITKRDHEELFLTVGKAYKLPVVALRYFNVYGSRQALSNPYTGVAAIFCARILQGLDPQVFEDGLQMRDFVHVSDVAKANLLALHNDTCHGEVFNIGSGQAVTVSHIASTLCSMLAAGRKPQITGKFRSGDIRHCFADITKAKERLGFLPQVSFEDGMCELVEWVRSQSAPSGTDISERELDKRNLLK